MHTRTPQESLDQGSTMTCKENRPSGKASAHEARPRRSEAKTRNARQQPAKKLIRQDLGTWPLQGAHSVCTPGRHEVQHKAKKPVFRAEPNSSTTSTEVQYTQDKMNHRRLQTGGGALSCGKTWTTRLGPFVQSQWTNSQRSADGVGLIRKTC